MIEPADDNVLAKCESVMASKMGRWYPRARFADTILPRVVARCRLLQAEVQKLRAILHKVEWVHGACLFCGHQERDGHGLGCSLDQAIME